MVYMDDGLEEPLEELEDAAREPPAALDENLTALAEAEAQVEAIDARIAAGDRSLPYETVAARLAMQRRKRGSAIWGACAMIAALGAGGVAILLRRPVMEGILMGIAVATGTLGCRRIAGRRMALTGRVLAWSVPALMWLAGALVKTFRGTAEGEWVIAAAGAMVWMALGLFGFAILDALLAP